MYAPGATVTLTAKPNSGVQFGGWGGACAGNALTCTVTLQAESTVTALFVSSHTLSVGLTNSGTVTSSPAGINCPSPSCSAKFPSGTAVTLTAVPPAGKSFVGWSGACSGADPQGCTVTITADTKVQASFSK